LNPHGFPLNPLKKLWPDGEWSPYLLPSNTLLVQLDYSRRRSISSYIMSEVIPLTNFAITSQSNEKGATAIAVTP
jgi:hypothetical protein